MVELLEAMKSPSTSIHSNGEGQVFHGREPQQKRGPTWVKHCHPPLLLCSYPTLWLPMTALPKVGEEETWGHCCLLNTVFALRRPSHLGSLRWNTLDEASIDSILFPFQQSQKVVSKQQFGLLGFSGVYFSPFGGLCQLLLHAYETHNFQPFLTGVE